MSHSPRTHETVLVFGLLAVAALSACNTEQFEPINIAVYPSTMSCAIKDKAFDCTQAGAYLRDTLKAAPTRDITVSFAGSETVQPENKSLERIAELVKAAGYANVRAIRFDMK